MNKVTYEGITFNADWGAAQTEKAFCDHEAHHGLSKDQLKEAYKLCKEAVKPAEVKPEPAA